MSHKNGVFPIVIVMAVVGVAAQHEPGSAGKTRMTDQQNITSAMSAAPEEIAKAATIMGWPEGASKEMRQLRAGTNGWACFPSSPAQSEHTRFEDPMCMDKAWQGWAKPG